MKFLCLDCDEPMKLHSTEGPEEGSLTVTFRCPECGFRVAMLTNPFETQMVRSLGVQVGGRTAPAQPFEHLRSALAGARGDVFEGATEAPPGEGGGCPFAAMVGQDAALAPDAAAAPGAVRWTPAAQARLERVPSFIRAMARRAIERFAAERGYAAIDEAVMDEARSAFGM